MLTDTEAGTGSSSIASEGMQLEVVTELPSYQGIALTGVAKLNYKNSTAEKIQEKLSKFSMRNNV